MAGTWGWKGIFKRALEFVNGTAEAVSPQARARLRYNQALGVLQVSVNGGPYLTVATSGSDGWTDEGDDVVLTDQTDRVGIGAVPDADEKLVVTPGEIVTAYSSIIRAVSRRIMAPFAAVVEATSEPSAPLGASQRQAYFSAVPVRILGDDATSQFIGYYAQEPDANGSTARAVAFRMDGGTDDYDVALLAHNNEMLLTTETTELGVAGYDIRIVGGPGDAGMDDGVVHISGGCVDLQPYVEIGPGTHAPAGLIRLPKLNTNWAVACDADPEWAFAQVTSTYTFNGTIDDVLKVGWNTPGADTSVDALHSIFMTFESDYNDGANHHTEWHVEYRAAAGAATRRPISCNVNPATHAGSVGISGAGIIFYDDVGNVRCQFFGAGAGALSMSSDVYFPSAISGLIAGANEDSPGVTLPDLRLWAGTNVSGISGTGGSVSLAYGGGTSGSGKIKLQDKFGNIKFQATDINVEAGVPSKLKSYSKGALPTVATHAQSFIWVADEAGGAQPAYSDGVNWRRVSDGAVVS